MNWALHIGKSARKNLARFPKKDQKRIATAMREFVFNPYEGDIEKIEGEINVWRRRVGNYRILYEVDATRKLICVRDVNRRTSNTY